jgi:uncharacterized membrane protein
LSAQATTNVADPEATASDPTAVELPWDLAVRFAAATAGALMLHYGWDFWNAGNVYLHHEIAAMDLLVYTEAFGLFWLALVQAPRWRGLAGPLILSAALLTAVVGTYTWTHSVFRTYPTDVMAFDHYSAQLVLRGVDPYAVSMRPAFQQFHIPLIFQTLTWDGRLVDRLSYPAGSFLMFVPFVALGVSDLRWVVLLSHLAMLGVLYAASPGRFRPFVLIPVLACPEIVEFTGGGTVDIPWTLALLLMIVWQRRPFIAGLCYGAACALKQEPWFLAPFLVVYYLRDCGDLPIRERFARLSAFAGSAAALFLTVNGPFIAHDPQNWILGTLEPALGNLIAFGQGPSMLVQFGASLSANAFLIVAGAIALVLLLSYGVYFDKLRDAVWMFPILITWFMPRSLHNYFVFWVPAITLAVALRSQSAGSAAPRAA